MIAVDTQILVYAHKQESSFHTEAKEVLSQLAESPVPWALPWPVLHEFLAISTHPRIYRPPSTQEQAFGFLESLMDAPGLRLLSEGPAHFETLREMARKGKIKGAIFHDARIAALCLAHGAKELWTADRDFSRMKGLKIRNPLMEK